MTTGSAAGTAPARWAAPVALTVLTAVGALGSEQPGVLAPAAVGLVCLVATAAAWRRLTGPRLLAALAVVAPGVVAVCWGDPRDVGWFGCCVVAGWAALASSPRLAVAAGAALAAVFAAQLVLLGPEPGWVTWTAGIAFTTSACVFARRQRVVVEQLHAAQSELAERTRLDERHRIAGEMHDVVGHALTVTLLHLGSARLSLDDDLDRVRSSLAEAERAARASLDDVRAAVALLRAPAPPGAASAPPTPTAADITGLVESFRRTGTPVEVQVRGDLAALGANRGLAAYRIVQESLTNAARHGDGSPITVRLDTAADRTTITVRSGAAAPSPQPAGTGLTAMRERAEALGGQLVAGPATGGWRVEAVLPA